MQQNNLPTIGVTGITGSGSSTVAGILAERGGFIVSADKLAHEVMARDGAAYPLIIRDFGEGILDESGDINRRVLGARVFENKEELQILEAIIHPLVIQKTAELISEAAATGDFNFAVIDAPLLIESGMYKKCDSTWLVTASDRLRKSRIIGRDNIDEETAERRLANRAGDESLRPYADFIINNDGDVERLKKEVFTVFNNFLQSDGIVS